jgi:putative endonuclease
MVRCNDDSFYVGTAIDVGDRVKRHNWRVIRRPVELVWQERCGNPDAARAREKEIKGWSRKEKFELVAGKRACKPFAPKTGSG